MNRMRAVAAAIIAAAAIGTGIAVTGILSKPPDSISSDNHPAPVGDRNINGSFVVLPDSSPPLINIPNSRVEKVVTGLESPTSMTFLDNSDLLILEKNTGRLRLVEDGHLQENSIYDVAVSSNSERGLLGIAIVNEANLNEDKTIYLYYTEQNASGEIRNRIYRYHMSLESEISNGALILDLPGTPGPNHDGGKLAVGPDGMLYAVIGDLNRNGMLQNYPEGGDPDDTSVILRVDSTGSSISGGPLTDSNPPIDAMLSKYYAYGIRNSFGIDFDPKTGHLWDTENGPSGYDEINIVPSGFNSGWEKIMGPMERTNIDVNALVMFNGANYLDPAFSWRFSRGITDIEFFNSTRLGEKYAGNIFVGDINNGNLYFFGLNEQRDGLTFDISKDAGLADRVADNENEVATVTVGSGFRGITDIETGPDGYLYILSYSGNLYRIVPDY